MSDLKPFKHGEEGTHSYCDYHDNILKQKYGSFKREVKWDYKCCECSPTPECKFTPPQGERR